MTKIFAVGKSYNIIDGSKVNSARSNKSLLGVTWNNEIVFEYQGKRGIHHCFRAIPGGWSRTYTDFQLVGKKIREVKSGGTGNNTRI